MHDNVEAAYPFTSESKDLVAGWITRLTAAYAKCVTHGDFPTAQKHLRIHQREHVWTTFVLLSMISNVMVL